MLLMPMAFTPLDFGYRRWVKMIKVFILPVDRIEKEGKTIESVRGIEHIRKAILTYGIAPGKAELIMDVDEVQESALTEIALSKRVADKDKKAALEALLPEMQDSLETRNLEVEVDELKIRLSKLEARQ